MAKPHKPLLSFGARGTITDSLTFQKRGRATIVRQKPIPKDPKSPAQLAWRQVYRDAVASWNSLTTEEKEAWRGICPGLTPYQCFMSSELVYAPPPIPIDIGPDPIDRGTYSSFGWTKINKDNPANASGILHTVKVWAYNHITDLKVGTFYTTNEDRLKCRDTALISYVQSGAERTFTGLSIAVEEGDYIGCFFPSGALEGDISGFAGLWQIYNDYVDPGEEANYAFKAGNAMSLYGIGTAD